MLVHIFRAISLLCQLSVYNYAVCLLCQLFIFQIFSANLRIYYTVARPKNEAGTKNRNHDKYENAMPMLALLDLQKIVENTLFSSFSCIAKCKR